MSQHTTAYHTPKSPNALPTNDLRDFDQKSVAFLLWYHKELKVESEKVPKAWSRGKESERPSFLIPGS